LLQKRNLAKLQEAERLCLSALLKHPSLIEEEGIHAGLFSDSSGRGLLSRILSCRGVASNSDELDAGSLRVAMGDSAYDSLASIAPYSQEQARNRVRQFLDLSIAARIDESLQEVWRDDYKEGAGSQRLERLRRVLQEVQPEVVGEEVPTLEEITREYLSTTRRELEQGISSSLRCGMSIIDSRLRGLRSSELLLLAGDGGSGKTTFLQQIVRGVSRGGGRVYLASAEMAASQLGERESRAAVCLDQTREWGSVQVVDRAIRVIDMEREVLGRISVDNSWSITPSGLESRVRRVTSERGVDLLAIDHLDHMRVGDLEGTEKLSSSILAIKGLAKALAIPVIVITHLNREGERDLANNSTPSKSWLRGSTHLGQVPDNIIILTRKIGELISTAWVIKARQTGLTGSVSLRYNQANQEYTEIDRDAT
jgi:replicative DNA helicase